jgi:ABC-type histidine transport system ATPase subunit/phage FluMu protein Com
MERVTKEDTRKQLAAVVAAAPDDMRLVRLSVENVMKIRFVDIKPKGNVIVVGGRNGQGKSSLLQSIGFLLCGGDLMPTDVIRAGQKTATITGQVGPFKITRYFHRKNPDEGKNSACYLTKIKVQGPNGEEYRERRQLLDMMLETLSFDPMEFMRMEAKQQFAELKKLSRFDADLDALDQAQQVDYDARRKARYEADAVTARLKALLTIECPRCKGAGEVDMPMSPSADKREKKPEKEDCPRCNRIGLIAEEIPAEVADQAHLAKLLEEGAAHNAAVVAARAEKERLETQAQKLSDAALVQRASAVRMLAEASELDGLQYELKIEAEASGQGTVQQLLEEASKIVIGEEIDTVAVSAQLQAAMAGAAAIERGKTIRALQVEHVDAWKAWNELNDRMKERTREREEAIQKAHMPVEGLAIGDGEVMYNALPFNQASGSEQIRVSMAIGMATNPKLKILRFRDGGWDQLDEESQGMVRAEIEKHRFQLWVEHVGTSGAPTVVMEDGTAKGDDVVPRKDTEESTD